MLKIDLHIHTVASGHAYNTILEYIYKAQELKMIMIGFSEHGPDMKGSVAKGYFTNLGRLPRKVGNLIILRGIEANIINKKGEIDISDDIIKNKLDYVIAGMHKGIGFNNDDKKNNTTMLVNAIRSGKIDILSHPFLNHRIPFDVKRVYEEACKRNVLLEINMHYLSKPKIRENNIKNLKIMIQTAKDYDKKVILNTDAHSIWELADDGPLKKIKKEIGLTDKMIINNYPKELLKQLKINEQIL